MKLSDFDYHLPGELIAQKPAFPRDHSRLLVLDKKSKNIDHKYFYNVADYFKKGDVVVLNNTKVFPARLIGRRQDTGGKVEVFLLRQVSSDQYECLIGNRRKRIGQTIIINKGFFCLIVKQIDQSVWQVRFNLSGKKLEAKINQFGLVPTPPYIKVQSKSQKLKKEYQTVFAKYSGSVAAPTAGFHFTKPLMAKLKKQGIEFAYVTLHVGLGTFAPVKANDITKHQMYSEYAMIDKKTADKLNQAKKQGKRIIAVGTTSVRTLETFSHVSKVISSRIKGQVVPGKKWTNIFIYPGYKFKFVDAMITNFHLPKSTLLMLVSAFAGHDLILKAYNQAIKKKYRFYSFGDAMLII
jgi:S-adenosylmethionine:tRNA ribosyltransferase-isomerase